MKAPRPLIIGAPMPFFKTGSTMFPFGGPGYTLCVFCIEKIMRLFRWMPGEYLDCVSDEFTSLVPFHAGQEYMAQEEEEPNDGGTNDIHRYHTIIYDICSPR